MKKVDWNTVSYIQRSKNRSKSLTLLEKPMMLSELSKEMEISLTYASKIVRELNSKSLVDSLTDDLKVGRIYRINIKCLKVCEQIGKYGNNTKTHKK